MRERGEVRRAAVVAPFAMLAMLATGCRSGPSRAELARLRAEAVAANQAMIASRAAAADSVAGDAVGQSLVVSGQIAGPTTVLSWQELQGMATSHVRTVNPQNPTDRAKVIDFRGIVVSDLLARFAPATAATDVTFVALDGFRSTVDITGLRKFRVMLALEADGAPIARPAGGPIFLVFPYTDSPGSRVYEDRYWCFYVTHMIVGTDSPHLAIGDRALDAAALARLEDPDARLDGPVHWKGFWPTGDVRVRGVPLVDALRAAMTTVPAGGRLIIHGKAAIHRDPDKPIAIAAADLYGKDGGCFLLVTRWGLDDAPVSAQMGGPIALAVGPSCADRYGDRFWVPFVDELVVEP